MEYRRLFLIFIVVMSVSLFACQKSELENNSLPLNQTSPTVLPTVIPVSDSSIRNIDFKNFTFLYTPEKGGTEGDTFTLKNGRKEMIREKEDGAELGKIEYGDVTNDGIEEAIMNIYPLSDGNCSCDMVFIFTIKNRKPKLLWSFDTWDKADGGFKKAYSESNNLVVETFGDNEFENDNWKFRFPEKSSGYCCPTAFTKIVFRWNGEKFVPSGDREVFPYDWKRDQSVVDSLPHESK